MKRVPESSTENERLSALRRYDILDTPPEDVFDDVATVAAQSCGTPIALITLVDATRQWFKSRHGLEVRETPREVAFCDHAIRGDTILEVNDARRDERFRDNPLVTGKPHIRFYAGAVLKTPDGHNLGTLCVIDRKPGRLTSAQRATLQALARQVVLQLELRRTLVEAERSRAALAVEIQRTSALEKKHQAAERFMRETIDAMQDNIAIVDRTGAIIHVNRSWDAFARNNAAPALLGGLGPGANYLEVCDRAEVYGDRHAGQVARALRSALQGSAAADYSLEYPCHAPGEQRWFIVRISAFMGASGACAVISHQNITQRVHAERQVMQLNEALEERVRARTAELEQAYASLSASEEKFRSLFENAQVGMVVVDGEGRLLQVNRAYCAITGREPAQLLGTSLADLVHADDQQRLRALRAQVIAGRIPGFEAELRYDSVLGEIAWVHVSVAAVRNADDSAPHTVALVQNITQHKQAEYERDRFFDLSVDMLVIVRGNETLQRVNPACTRILGYSEIELLGMRYIDLVHPEDRARARGALARVVAGESLPLLDVRMMKKDGEYRDIRWSAAPWTDESLVVAVGRDVTVQRATELVLRERETMLVRAENMASMGSWHYNIENGKITCSQALLEITGRAESAEPGGIDDLLAFLAEEDRDKARAEIGGVLGNGRPAELLCRVHRPDGTYRQVQSFIAPMRLQDGRIYGVSGACLDVTDFKAAEERALQSERRLRALAARLQSIREEERTSMSREIHDDIGQMLTALKMDLTLLRRDAAKPGWSREGRRIADEMGSMERLADATLEAVRRLARQLRPDLLDALGIVPAIESHVEELNARTGLCCAVHAPEDLPQPGPEQGTALFRITQEALTNVIRHAGASNVQVSLKQAGGELTLSVHDDGKGFDPGETVAGASLGLLGMRERATMIGAAFDIESRAGAGTTITVRVPLAAQGKRG